jgi:hypothetical protein
MAVKLATVVNQKFIFYLNGTPHRFAVRATNPKYSLEKIKCLDGYCLRLQIPGLPDDEEFLLATLEPHDCLRVRTVSGFLLRIKQKVRNL